MKPSTSPSIPNQLQDGLNRLVQSIYPQHDCYAITARILETYWPDETMPVELGRTPETCLWDESDAYVITYGNSILDGTFKPLDLLYSFLHEHLKGVISGVHILPYFPFTSDDGFAVVDFREVNSGLGAWEDIGRIADDFRLMSDLVINHCSSQSFYFNKFLQGHEPYNKFFFEAGSEEDVSMVVRPRAHPLLRKVDTSSGEKHVWCTFSHDQIDFDFSNPEVLIEFLSVLRFHIDRGVRTIRLDAVAFLWKELGTSCIHLRQTHEIIRLLRLLADFSEEEVILITETNVPNAENLSYFGNQNEAHAVYNFSLPPLLLHALFNGTSEHLNAWAQTMPQAQPGCFYFNFTASHDGIGLRPAEGLLAEEEIQGMIDTVKDHGGLVSMRESAGGEQRPYEMNITLFDALKGTNEGLDNWQVERFLCSQILAMGLEGIPAFYIHSLLATPNDHAGVERTNHNRTINRHRWNLVELLENLKADGSPQKRVFDALKWIIKLRTQQKAFHPNGGQSILQLGHAFFGFKRGSIDQAQTIYAVHNMTSENKEFPVIDLDMAEEEAWHDLLSGEQIQPGSEALTFSPYQCRWITNQR
ncbi:MAG: sugar phosphorylase [Pseudomonadota bacterium]